MRNPLVRQIKVSIVLPVYNTEEFLPRCLDSLVAQTLTDIEIVVVSDASPGNCRAVVDQYRRNGVEIVYIEFETNRSALQARIEGAKRAHGEYVLYVDPDDWISTTTCETLYATAKKHGAEFVRYSMVVGEPEKGFAPLHPFQASEFSGEAVLDAFLDGTFDWALCSKLFSRDLVMRALEFVEIAPDAYISNANDLAQIVPLVCVAQSFVATADARATYFYVRHPRQVTFNIASDARRWERYCESTCKAHEIAERALSRLRRKGDDLARFHALRMVAFRYRTWELGSADPALRPSLFLKLFQSFDQALAVASLDASAFPLIAAAAAGVEVQPRQVKHVGIEVVSLYGGGAERGVVFLADLFVKAGRQVTLLTSEPESPQDYPYDKDRIARTVLPSDRKARWGALQSISKSLDAVVLNSHWAEQIGWDILALRFVRLPTIVFDHSMYFYPMYNLHERLARMRPHAYRTATAVVCMLDADASWYRAAGYDNVFHIPNLFHFDVGLPKATGASKTVLYVGRLVADKGLFQLLQMMALVVRRSPEARLVLCGRFFEQKGEAEYYRSVKQLGLHDHVILAGQVRDVETYYSQARVFVLASEYEGASRVLVEAKAQALPTVVCGMPYLSAVGEEHGAVVVGKKDTEGMAAAVLQLLTDDAYWQMMSARAYRSLEYVSEPAAAQGWMSLFGALESDDIPRLCREQALKTAPDQVLAMTMNEIDALFEKLDGKRRELKAELEQTRRELRTISNGRVYKVVKLLRRILVKIPFLTTTARGVFKLLSSFRR